MTRIHWAAFVVGIAWLGVVFAAGNPEERYAGTVHYQNGRWPVLLTLSGTDGSCTMSFPALGVAGMGVNAERDGEALTVALPYGLGEQTLRPDGDGLRTDASPSDPDAVAVVLSPDAIPAPTRHPIGFEHDGVSLQGELFVPVTSGDSGPPLVVVGHGAGRTTRGTSEYLFWAEFLTREGYAVFLYDKRGLGGSGGEYPGADLETLTGDFTAAVRAAAARPEIDAGRVAILGWSQFGWIGFDATSKLEGMIDAAILLSPPAVDPVTLELGVIHDALRTEGLDAESMADAMAYVRLYFAAARRPSLFDRVAEWASEAEGTPWIAHVPVPSSPDDLAWWGDNAGTDPAAGVTSFGKPVLAVFGANDRRVNPESNALRFELLAQAGGSPTEVWIADEADHRLEVPARMIQSSLRFPSLAPGLLDRITRFLDANLCEN